jgi:hypothetical protein
MDSMVLTFAEIGFLLRSNPPRYVGVRERLLLEEPTDAVVAAGLSSLMARGLCARNGDEVAPGPEIVAISAGLSRARVAVRAAGRIGERTVLAHVFSGDEMVVALSPAEFGQFGVELLDRNVDLAEQVTRFVDACVVEGAESAVVVDAAGEIEVSLAVAREADGTWFVSDTRESPDRGMPTDRAAVVARIAELFGLVSPAR